MKNFTIVPVLLLLLLLLVYQCTHAQDYVITAKGDSIAGEVKPLNFGMDKKVIVIQSDKKKNTFSIFQVKEFRLKGDLYRPVKNGTSYTFMKLVRPGYLAIYAFQQENQPAYDGLFLFKRDGASLEVPNLSFKKLMSGFLKDCPDISKKINSGEYGKKELNLIVDEYNQCITSRTIDHQSTLVVIEGQNKKITQWNDFEQKVKEASDFREKGNALDMITEIKGKISRDEKIPNFLIDGLKNSLSTTDLSDELETVLQDLASDQ